MIGLTGQSRITNQESKLQRTRSWERQRDQFPGMSSGRADWYDDVLLAIRHIGHRAAHLVGWQGEFPQDRAGLFIQRPEHWPTGERRLGREPSAFARKQQRLRQQHTTAFRLPGSRKRYAFQQRMVLDTIRRLTVRHHP